MNPEQGSNAGKWPGRISVTCDSTGSMCDIHGIPKVLSRNTTETEYISIEEHAHLLESQRQLTREAEARAERYRVALEVISSDNWVCGECQVTGFNGLDEKAIAKQALAGAEEA